MRMAFNPQSKGKLDSIVSYSSSHQVLLPLPIPIPLLNHRHSTRHLLYLLPLCGFLHGQEAGIGTGYPYLR